MIRNGYVHDPSEWEVVVLDFDLSWHKDALEQSISAGKFTSGYLAPEQLQPDKTMTTRSALVDSFGLGMTLYFLRTAQEPVQYQHQHGNWAETLGHAAGSHPCRQWRSLPSRYFRLISQV